MFIRHLRTAILHSTYGSGVNFAWLPSIDFSRKCFTIIGSMISTSAAAFPNRPDITAKMRLTSASDRHIVSPSMMTSAGTPCSAISPPQSSMADMAIWETVPHARGSAQTPNAAPEGKPERSVCFTRRKIPSDRFWFGKSHFLCRDFPKPGKRHWRGEYRFSKL